MKQKKKSIYDVLRLILYKFLNYEQPIKFILNMMHLLYNKNS